MQPSCVNRATPDNAAQLGTAAARNQLVVRTEETYAASTSTVMEEAPLYLSINRRRGR